MRLHSFFPVSVRPTVPSAVQHPGSSIVFDRIRRGTAILLFAIATVQIRLFSSAVSHSKRQFSPSTRPNGAGPSSGLNIGEAVCCIVL
ncbi:hypothetical protein BDR03DRAFT_940668 [Suillus americanus]|nr:hypothetical protein BDR03DRAFT_940668 [Suillus americanus]